MTNKAISIVSEAPTYGGATVYGVSLDEFDSCASANFAL